MRQNTQTRFEVIGQAQHQAELDLVVPFTTPELTRAAVDAANRMGAGLNANLRLVKLQVVPFPLDLEQSPVFIDFLKNQLAQFHADVSLAGEIRLTRDFEAGLLGTLRRESVVVLATPRRPWQTRTRRLAETLRRAGHKVVLVTEKLEAEMKTKLHREAVNA